MTALMRMGNWWYLVCAVTLAILTNVALGQTVTVTTTADVIDIDWQSATIDDLPGPDGEVSFSEAMIATDNTPGHQTVEFAIPESELGWCCSQYDGIAVFHSVTGYFWRANDEVTIDGTTQTAFVGDTNPIGAEILLYGKTFYLNDDNSILRGFHGTSVQSGGANSLIEENTGGMNLTLFSGGGSTVRNNDCGTIKIDRSDGNFIVGNTMSRVRVIGFGNAQPAMNNRIGGPQPEDRNYIKGYGTWNSEGLPAGSAVQLAWTEGTLIENNWIGTTTDGLSQGNLACTMGISFETENHNITVRDNLIAGILGEGRPPHHAGQYFGWAVYFWGTTTGVEIADNTIGLDANGAATLGSVWGVNVDNYQGYTVEDVGLTSNVIAGHRNTGVRVAPTATMRLSQNVIYENVGLGNDLIPSNFSSGVSPNDPFDADSGGNDVQNFPVIDAAVRQGATINITGLLHSSPLDEFSIEFFASPECDASGYGDAMAYLGATQVGTDAVGDAALDVVIAADVAEGWFVTATATREPAGATSEFCMCAVVVAGTLPGDLDGDGDVDQADLGILLGDWGCTGGDCAGDVDGDGDTDQADLGALLASYGAG